MEKLKRKKIIIIFVYIVLFALFVSGVYSFLKPEESCSDGIKNQNEQGIDCGGVCLEACENIKAQDLIVLTSDVVPSGVAGKYDFYAKIKNPNVVFGSKNFGYNISFKDSLGKVVVSQKGNSFILPGESKYIVENNIDSPSIVSSVDLEVSNPDWVEFFDYYEKPDIQIVNKKYSEISSGSGFSEATGLLKNKSAFDFDTIKIQVILKDNDGSVIALNSTQMKTVKSGEEREVKVFWPSSFPGTVGNMEAQAEVNIFNSDTFLRRFYKTEKFQNY